MTATSAEIAVQIPRTGRYEIDPQGSTVAFKGRHLFGLAPVRGSLAIRRGAIDVADPVGHSSVHVELDAASFHTGNRQRDSRSPSRPSATLAARPASALPSSTSTPTDPTGEG